MRYVIIAKDRELAKDYVYARTCGMDVYMKKSYPTWELVLYRGDIWTILDVDDFPRDCCGMTIDEVHFMEDLTIKEMYSTIDYIGPMLCSSVSSCARIFLAGREFGL